MPDLRPRLQHDGGTSAGFTDVAFFHRESVTAELGTASITLQRATNFPWCGASLEILVEFNGAAGIAVYGNPVSASGQPNIGNAIEGNSVFQNGRSNPSFLVGIDLSTLFAFSPLFQGGVFVIG